MKKSHAQCILQCWAVVELVFVQSLCMSCLDGLTPCSGIWEHTAYIKTPACFNQEMSGFQVWHYLAL